MKIKKLSHCCLIIQVKGKKILTDPGYYSVEQHGKVNDIDIVLITHEHADHFHIESLKQMLKRMSKLTVITNDAVGEILAKEGIVHHVMKHGTMIDHEDIHIEAFGKKHALMHRSIPAASNVGFLIERKLFFPGDAFTDPKKPVDVLALPVAGPWMKISEAIDYALEVKPRIAFPIHDGMRIAMQHLLPEKILGQNGIEFMKLEEEQEIEV